jgi:hypothetical protein
MSAIRSPLFPDFVSSDVAALAAHMRDCADSRGPLFRLRGGLQTAHALAAGRIVTLACVVCVVCVVAAGLITVI